MQKQEFLGGPFDVALTKLLGHPVRDAGFEHLHTYGPGKGDWFNFALMLRDWYGHLLTHEELTALQEARTEEVKWWREKQAAKRRPCPTCNCTGWVG
jgi:hypothetical protein